MMVALNGASLIPREGAAPINGEPLAELVRQYNLANAIMMRLTRVIDRAALTAIMSGVTLQMNTLDDANASAQALEKGIRVKTSSHARHHVNVTMARSKMSGTYPNSVLATLEATMHGYDEGLLLDVDGFVAEGAGENIFVVKEGTIYEPELTSALTGITRASA